jgi:hypothetical protein
MVEHDPILHGDGTGSRAWSWGDQFVLYTENLSLARYLHDMKGAVCCGVYRKRPGGRPYAYQFAVPARLYNLVVELMRMPLDLSQIVPEEAEGPP